MNQSKQILLELDARFVFRMDASPATGVGHAMRSTALAETLSDLGFKTIFVGKTSQISWLENRIDAITGSSRVSSECNIHFHNKRDILVIDSYDVDPKSGFINGDNWISTAAFVDGSSPKYMVDTYIHPGPNYGWKLPSGAKGALVLSGVEYIPIRKSIENLNPRRERNSGKTVITVVAGGTDPTNFIIALIPNLASIEMEFEVRLFTSQKEIKIPDSRFSIYSSQNELEDSLQNSDVVITTGGTTAWEICSLGIPMGIAQAVDNQKQNFDFFTSNNLAVGVGTYSLSLKKWDFFMQNIHTLVTSINSNKKLVENQLLLPIRGGSKRIASELIQSIAHKIDCENY